MRGWKSVSLDYKIYIGSSIKNIYLFLHYHWESGKKQEKIKKFVDDQYSVCYISLAMEVGLFFMPFFRSDLFWLKGVEKHKEFNGGGSCAHENNTGMYRMQES